MAQVHNLKNIDVDVPLGKIVGVAGVSGSGKSSLALGVLYAEGSRWYLESLSTYTRRRMTQAAKAQVDEVLYVPAALALRQRTGVPGIRSTFGTGTELLNSLRLMFSRLASHRCPNGHYVPPTLAVAAGQELMWSQETCPDCRGSRLTARWPKLRRITLDEACQMTLSELTNRVAAVPDSLPEEMRPMAHSICESFRMTAKRLMDLCLGYLTLDWASSTFPTGERQRMQLARAVRSRTTGVLYVLDEPSIGLHPANIVGLPGVMNDLVADGKSAILVDHDTQILESLMPGLEAAIQRNILPEHILHIEAENIQQVKLIDTTPIGINVRSAVATYANVHDELRKLFARTPDAKAHGYKTGDFSYNSGSLRCPTCDGTGVITLDMQFLPDVGIPCPDCGGSRYSQEIVL